MRSLRIDSWLSYNRTPTETLHGKTPFEILYSRPPPLDHLRVFGSSCYVHNRAHGGDKFTSPSLKCVFIGYPFGKKGWRVYDPVSKKIFVSHDVFFCEDEFLFQHVSMTPTNTHVTTFSSIGLPYVDEDIVTEPTTTPPVTPPNQQSSTREALPDMMAADNIDTTILSSSQPEAVQPEIVVEPEIIDSSVNGNLVVEETTEQLGRTFRKKNSECSTCGLYSYKSCGNYDILI